MSELQLKDPQKSRVVSSLSVPHQKPFPTSQLFKQNSINWKPLRTHLKKEGRITKEDVLTMIKMATNIFKNEPNLIHISDPVTIVGDIHGQYYDLHRLITQVGGEPNQNNYLFLGDYVDRGRFSIQVLILLLALKISYPKTIILLRGNHQCRHLTSHFSFRAQCLYKYDQQVYENIMDMFDTLPLACLINQRFLCLHGGISHELKMLNDIERIDRFHEIPKIGLFCDLVWADPVENPHGICQTLVKANNVRGCSYYFGFQLTRIFLERNKLISIIRAHQAQAEGFKFHHWGGTQRFPTVITLFSAPNYCDFYKNKAAVIKFVNNNLNMQQFVESPHPFLLPRFNDLFEFSVPFLIQKISQMFIHIIKPNKNYLNVELPFQFVDKKILIQKIINEQKKKIEQNLQMTKLNGFCPDDKLLQTGKFKLTSNESFEEKRIIDLQNQSRPMEI